MRFLFRVPLIPDLTRCGYQVVGVAESGTTLIATCRTTHPDLVITDLKMLDGDGGTAIEPIWQHEPIRVIVISAFPQDLPE